jgi:hypothetical protein
MSLLELLKAARKLISNPHKWTRMSFARDEIGYPTHPTNNDAVCYCSIGSLMKVNGCNSSIFCDRATMKINKAAEEMGYHNCVKLNDSASHADVLRMFDLAIEASS